MLLKEKSRGGSCTEVFKQSRLLIVQAIVHQVEAWALGVWVQPGRTEKNDCSRYGVYPQDCPQPSTLCLTLYSFRPAQLRFHFKTLVLSCVVYFLILSSLMTLRTHLIVTAPVPYGVFVLFY